MPSLVIKKDEYYINTKCRHLKALAMFNAQSLNRPSVLEQVISTPNLCKFIFKVTIANIFFWLCWFLLPLSWVLGHVAQI
jgi:hypothetical protein